MATTFIYFPSEVQLTSEVPDITIRTDAEALTIEISGSNATAYKERLYPFNGHVTLRGVSSLLEDAMRAHGLSEAEFTIEAYGNTRSEHYASLTLFVVFCDRQLVGGYSYDMLMNNFLTDTQYKRISADGIDTLYFYAPARALISYYAWYTYRLPGDTHDRTWASIFSANARALDKGIFPIEIRIADLIAELAQRISRPVEDITVQAITIRNEDHLLTYYVSPQKPSVAFMFRNSFNLLETVYLWAKTIEKLKVERSVAVCNLRSSFYDQTTTLTYEVETSPMTVEEAKWVEHLLASADVRLVDPNTMALDPDTDLLPHVLITDLTSEIQDGREDMNIIKFTWRFADERPALRPPLPGRIHQDAFTPFFN